jgi:iron-sulfur cluster repair protein YtfE (RIC family)
VAKTDNLRRQNDKVHAGLARAAALREELDALTVDGVQQRLGGVLSSFGEEVVPHARAEELVLYPAVAARFNLHLSSRLRREHREMDRLLEGLADSHRRVAVDGMVPAELSGQLGAMVRLMRGQLRTEEEVVLPMLEANLDEAEAYALYERMEEALFEDAAARTVERNPSAR